MEGYTPELVYHELPLLAYSGLGTRDESLAGSLLDISQAGSRISLRRTGVPGSLGRLLSAEFGKAAGGAYPWNATGNPDYSDLGGFKFLNTSDELIFPRRKAAPAAQSPSDEGSAAAAGTSNGPHSILSPLSPTSPLYPDGLISPLWMRKHQRQVPSVLICFFTLVNGANSSEADDELKLEINSIKSALTRSSFRTRLAVVVVSDPTASDTGRFEERLAYIRRGTGLDAKSTFFSLWYTEDEREIAQFSVRLLSGVQPLGVDYYRDLTKHTRRKKNRGGAGSGMVGLSSADWSARYDFKLGVFAEFRQEMDAAERHYSSALDELFGAESVLDSSSARSSEARSLADAIAIRMVRCLLWRSLTTAAAQAWSKHRDRVKALEVKQELDAASSRYFAWESRWTEIMAQLVVRAEVSAFDIQKSLDRNGEEQDFVVINITSPPEKSVAVADGLLPFHFLHHAGYWYRLARDWAMTRGASTGPLSEKGDSTQKLLDLTSNAIVEFDRRKQYRMTCQLTMDRARLLIGQDHRNEALTALRAVYADMTWRREGWWDLMRELITTLAELAHILKAEQLLAELQWEMSSLDLPSSQMSSEPLGLGAEPQVDIDDTTHLSPISLAFAFADNEASVGDNILCQLQVISHTHHPSANIALEDITLQFGESMSIRLKHDPSISGKTQHRLIKLVGVESQLLTAMRQLTGTTYLEMESSAPSVVLEFELPVRAPGELLLASAALLAQQQGARIRFNFTQIPQLNARSWWLPTGKGLIGRPLGRENSLSLEVHPKPPRVDVRLDDPRDQYFTSMSTDITISVLNGEQMTINGSISLSSIDDDLAKLGFTWASDGQLVHDQSTRAIEMLGATEQSRYTLHFTAPRETSTLPLTANIEYTTTDEPDAIVTKPITFNIHFSHPFTFDFDLSPLLDAELWPSFFNMPGGPDSDVSQQWWELKSFLTSKSSQPLEIVGSSLEIDAASESILCSADNPSDTAALPLTPGSTISIPSRFKTSRPNLDDRRPAQVELTMDLQWRIPGASTPTTSSVAIPALTIPAAEPRVLCTIKYSDSPSQEDNSASSPPVTLTYTIENPSSHYLTFQLSTPTAPAQDTSSASGAGISFALSGPKVRGVTLCPYERSAVHYALVLLDSPPTLPAPFTTATTTSPDSVPGPHQRGAWITPSLRVVDRFFGRELRVLPGGGQGVRIKRRSGNGARPMAAGHSRPGSAAGPGAGPGSGSGSESGLSGEVEVWVPY